MGIDDEKDRVGFVDFVHHDDAKEARNAKGHLVMNEKRLKIDVWYGYKYDKHDRSRSPRRRTPEYDDRTREDDGYEKRGRRRAESPEYR
jgi:RNA recognition motif-containing protein